MLHYYNRVDEEGRDLLVAVSFGLSASEVVAGRRSCYQVKRWEAYARLYKKVSEEWWCEPGHGDWCTCLEKYTLCRDGMYHKQDQFDRMLPTFIQILELTESEESEYWGVVGAVFEGKSATSVVSSASSSSSNCRTGDDRQRLSSGSSNNNNSSSSNNKNSKLMSSGINNKVVLLRAMLQWEEQLRSEAGGGGGEVRMSKVKRDSGGGGGSGSVGIGEVVIICWPDGEIMRLRSGSTAADAGRRVGLEGKVVLINGLLVVPSTELKDGDVVEVRM